MTPPELRTGAVTLRGWRPDDADAYIEMRDDLVFRFTTEPKDLDPARCRSNIEQTLSDPNQAPFAIYDGDGRLQGNLAVGRRGKTAVISYWLSPGGRGRGLATEALKAATEWVFAAWEVDRAELEIDPENSASLRVAEASGYHRRGLRLESACGGPAVVMERRLPVPPAETSG